jgi:hypothetical protein
VRTLGPQGTVHGAGCLRWVQSINVDFVDSEVVVALDVHNRFLIE